MPTKSCYSTALANTGVEANWTRLAEINGIVNCSFHAGAECQLVMDVDTAAAAQAAAGANGRFNITGSVSAPINFAANPYRTWIRANGASNTTVYCLFQW
jgi:hypothetical protein